MYTCKYTNIYRLASASALLTTSLQHHQGNPIPSIDICEYMCNVYSFVYSYEFHPLCGLQYYTLGKF